MKIFCLKSLIESIDLLEKINLPQILLGSPAQAPKTFLTIIVFHFTRKRKNDANASLVLALAYKGHWGQVMLKKFCSSFPGSTKAKSSSRHAHAILEHLCYFLNPIKQS